MITQPPTKTINKVANALISGFKPSRTRAKTSRGKVEYPGPDKNDAITTSSSDKVNASNHAASSAGAISGTETTKKTYSGEAPKLKAASAHDTSRLRIR